MNEPHGSQLPPPNLPTSSEPMTPNATPGLTVAQTDQAVFAAPPQVQTPQGPPPLSSTYAPPPYAPSPLVPNESSPSKKRGLLVGVGVVAALLVALGGVLAVRGNSGIGASTFSLQAAADAASNAQSVAYDMTFTTPDEEVKVTGQLDSKTQQMSMTMDMAGQGTMDMIADWQSNTAYYSSDLFSGLAPTKWISIDLSVIPGAVDQFSAGFPDNPLQVTELFDPSRKTTEVGKETINGVETMHYEVVVPTAEIKAKSPDALGPMGAAALEALPDEFVYQLYVTESNELARLTYDLDAAGTPISTIIDVKGIDVTEPITIPPASDVTDMTDKLAGAFGAMTDSATG